MRWRDVARRARRRSPAGSASARGVHARRHAGAGVAPPPGQRARHRADADSVAQELGALRADYVGPTGAQSVLQVALGDAGIRAVGLWAQVPHYVAGHAVAARDPRVLERLRDARAGSTVDLHGSTSRSTRTCEQVEEGWPSAPTSPTWSRPARGAGEADRGRCRPATSSPARSSGSSATRAEPPRCQVTAADRRHQHGGTRATCSGPHASEESA